jgi:hypothetical protein
VITEADEVLEDHTLFPCFVTGMINRICSWPRDPFPAPCAERSEYCAAESSFGRCSFEEKIRDLDPVILTCSKGIVSGIEWCGVIIDILEVVLLSEQLKVPSDPTACELCPTSQSSLNPAI